MAKKTYKAKAATPHSEEVRQGADTIAALLALLKRKENRGIQHEIAEAEGVSDQAVSEGLKKRNARYLALVAEKILERRAQAETDRRRLEEAAALL